MPERCTSESRHVVESEFWNSDIVFLRVAKDRTPGMVTGVTIRPNGSIIYEITWGGSVTNHFDCELSSEWIPNCE